MGATGEQTWVFPSIDMAANAIRGITKSVDSESDACKGNMVTLASVWGGTTSDSWQALQTRWDGKIRDVNQAAHNLANAIDEANQNMQQTEHRNNARYV
ncbi:WXG100 family type VII secretion target [Mycobacteroides abscessus]|uniref:WXG100 family type VII secretion target n=1 Tax=Mycobacteroides abscessus TaxID=36809 RepID=UPI00210372E8|nr:WXG100 family type VII secretion target [Mycobacteroides abscessus]